MMPTIGVVLIVFYVLCVGFLSVSWDSLSSRGRKFITFFAVGIFPFFGVAVITDLDLERVKKVSFCEKCHTMKPYIDIVKGTDLEPLSALHYQNNWVKQESACYECHTSYTMFGPVQAKLKGLRHMYSYYVEGGNAKPKLYEKYDSRECLRCHGPSRRYLKMKKHTKDANLIKDLQTGKRTCIEQECHPVIHAKPAETEEPANEKDKTS
ncbi:MAG: NapC/NirT family cytochrome c [Nitrospinae bacterium]|nr:NapC/NirT family cytochrome c [Nitrospinota bacterium]MBF0634380.1 NapC/NirT family cytochrome c [Nitrospinota bacterium]